MLVAENSIDLADARAAERAKYLALRDELPGYGSSQHGSGARGLIAENCPRLVVDLGCGRNEFCRSLRREDGVNAIGVDFVFEEADIVAPMHAVPLETGCANIVTAFDSLEHLLPEEVDAVIAEMGRLACNGGRFVGTISTRPSEIREGLHPTVRPLEWWCRRLSAVMRIDQTKPFIVGTFHAPPVVQINRADSAAVSRGVAEAGDDAAGMSVWTPDWKPANLRNWLRRRAVFLVLSGPSLQSLDLTLLHQRGIVSMGVNNSWLVHRPTLWTCVDAPDRFADVGWKDAGIVKFLPAAWRDARLRANTADGVFRPSSFTVAEMPSVWLYRRLDGFNHARFLNQQAGVSWGCDGKVYDSLGINGKRSVMQAALGLLGYLGAGDVFLVGADFRMTPESRYAFDESRSAEAVRHNNALYRALDERFRALRPEFARHGMRVWNATPGSGLTAFDLIDYREAVERATAEAGRPTNSRGWYEGK